MGRKRIGIVLLIVLVGVVFAWFRFPKATDAFQRDADVIRLRHLKHYGLLIEAYRQKTGVYPFQGKSGVPIYVHVANDEQRPYTKNGPPTPHQVVPFAGFVSELESGLGRTIKEYFDPQLRPMHKPNFYIYMVHGDAYFFAVHLHQPFSFAKKVADHYFKAEISNAANDQNKAWVPQKLFGTTGFVAALQTPVMKQGFFSERENRYIDFTKRNGALPDAFAR